LLKEEIPAAAAAAAESVKTEKGIKEERIKKAKSAATHSLTLHS
jgi:hypothetical protein